MKIQKIMFNAIFMSAMIFMGAGIATAEDEPEMNAQQSCEKEAKEAGMASDKDVGEYVAQCLAETQAAKEGESKD